MSVINKILIGMIIISFLGCLYIIYRLGYETGVRHLKETIAFTSGENQKEIVDEIEQEILTKFANQQRRRISEKWQR